MTSSAIGTANGPANGTASGTVLASETRRIETPNAVMTTLASPTLGGSESLSLWTVEMAPAAQGPLHTFDSEQVWTVLSGELVFNVDQKNRALAEGDSIVIPAGVERQITALSKATLIVCGSGKSVVSVAGEEDPRGVPAWVG